MGCPQGNKTLLYFLSTACYLPECKKKVRRIMGQQIQFTFVFFYLSLLGPQVWRWRARILKLNGSGLKSWGVTLLGPKLEWHNLSNLWFSVCKVRMKIVPVRIWLQWRLKGWMFVKPLACGEYWIDGSYLKVFYYYYYHRKDTGFLIDITEEMGFSVLSCSIVSDSLQPCGQ